ncbi:MAG TPA: hypothetical protein VFL65_07225 [Jatrophihabitans sp.]|nr:hypothetical protein [Jatrophihabitans sp.]
MSSWIDLQALWRIVLVGLICGAGLPALFAVGLRLLVPATPNSSNVATIHVAPPRTRILTAGLCFAVVVAAIGAGIYLIVAG